MTTIAQLHERVQYLFGERADQLAKETGVVKRKRQLGGDDCVQGLVFGLLANPDHSTEELACIVGRRDVQISASGLSQRFTQEAAQLLQRLLEEAVALGIEAERAVPSDLLSRFEAGIPGGSTSIPLPGIPAHLWARFGGGGEANKGRGEREVRAGVPHR